MQTIFRTRIGASLVPGPRAAEAAALILLGLVGASCQVDDRVVQSPGGSSGAAVVGASGSAGSSAGGSGGTALGIGGDPGPAGIGGDNTGNGGNGGTGDNGGAANDPCDAGFVLVNGSCVAIGAPRLVSPLSTARVSSHVPTLKWALGGNSDGTHVDLCSDRACGTVVASFEATGTAGAPTADLAPGTLFWRAYGKNGSKTGLVSSPVWQFNVGHRSAPINTSWGDTPDFNGDGFADLVISDGVTVYIYFGNATGVAGTPVPLSAPAAGGTFGVNVTRAGDVNGDGFADLLVDYVPQGGTNVSVLSYFGGPDGLATTPSVTLFSPAGPSPSFAQDLSSAGDFNGDGYGDVFISTSNEAFSYIFFGSAAGLTPTGYTSLDSGAAFGRSVASAGDVNGDGFGDVVISDDGPNNRTGRVLVFFGSVASPGSNRLTLDGPDGANAEFGRSVAGADDVNGDGYADILVGEDGYNNVGRAFVYFGSASGPVTPAGVTLDGPDGMGNLFGFWVSELGDVNGDGYDDLVVGTDQTGRVYVYHGGTGTIGPAPSSTPTRPNMVMSFGAPLIGAGDFNGDGFNELLVTGDAACLYLGSQTGLRNTVSATLSPTATAPAFGYYLGSLFPGQRCPRSKATYGLRCPLGTLRRRGT